MRELEERVAAVYDDVTLGGAEEETQSQRLSSNSAVRKRLDKAQQPRKPQPGQ